ncbi:STM3941 family protein [Chryseobacterium sp. StRB126]|uniref:STM3941 family protein n=1 Tax=Chryseobacterium sp. StRB126 TaxID=878220 RepID=UPI0005ED58B0|nr:STM3941 family protein [Chryseobacterium sp. StRB126]
MAEIKFRKSNIIISIILCLLGFFFFVYLLLTQYFVVKIISILWVFIVLYIIFIKYRQLVKVNKGIPGLEISNKGITNHTSLQSVFIDWNDIESFQAGFYRTTNIFIHSKDPAKYKDQWMNNPLQLIGSFFSSKPESLWIDTETLDIEKKELLVLLNHKLRENT